MDRPRRFSPSDVIGFMIIAAAMCIYAAGCTGPRQIVAPDAKELSMSDEGRSERGGFTLRATILGKEQTKRLLNVDVASRSVAPVLFVITNQDNGAGKLKLEVSFINGATGETIEQFSTSGEIVAGG
jgi:hypothetical protein